LELTDANVKFVLDAPWPEVQRILEQSLIGINAMWNEHFGMGIVEYMAAGLIPVVHNSAGPKLDVVKDEQGAPGFFFTDPSDPDYSEATKTYTLTEALSLGFHLTQPQRSDYSTRAYAAAQRFSDRAFAKGWADRVQTLDKLADIRRRERTRNPLIPN
jgi:alpha-1,2-mannosyltransferase